MFGDYKMNAKLATKLNLLNYIKSFSMPDFPDLKIFSKTFFNDLFFKSYKNDSQYTLLYGDIDGLRKLNDSIGFDKADLAIEELLKTILNQLPENVVSARMGGDEFCFIIPDLSTAETRKLTKQIHKSLSSNELVKGLDITFGACDSNKFDNIKIGVPSLFITFPSLSNGTYYVYLNGVLNETITVEQNSEPGYGPVAFN